MPQKDRTGPEGKGPMTGRGLGFCTDNKNPNFFGFNEGFGIGFRRRDNNRGFRNRRFF